MKINKLLESKQLHENHNGLNSFLTNNVVEIDGVIGIDPKELKASNMPRGCRLLSGSLWGGRVYDHGTILWKGAEYVFRVRKDGSVKIMTTAQAGSNWSETIFKESVDNDVKKEYINYCKDLGIDSSKKSSMNRFMNDYAKHINNNSGIKDLEDKLNQVKKSLKKNESTLPRNASKIRATHRYGDKQSMEMSKDGKYWRHGGEMGTLYDPSFLRRSFDIEVLETDPNYKPNRTKPEYVVQGNYGYGWDDLTASDNYSEARADLKSYRENERNASHRLITRRVPVNESKSIKESRPDKEQPNTSNKKVTIKYGNSVKEVETCKPIKVTNKQLQDYRDNYSQVTIVESKSTKTFGAKGKKLKESAQDTVTRYQVEYFIDENDDSDTPLETYVYTDNKQEAIAKVKAEYPNAQIVYCVSETVPASYKEWDMKEGYEFNPNNADISWRPYDNEKGQVMADKWYESKWPDDEVGIEQLKGITLDDALKDRSILGHCDTQVRERVYAQLDKYIPLSVDSPMYKKKNESKSIDKYSKSHTPKMEGYFSDDDVEDDIEHANLYGGDTMYCRDCGTKKKWDDGYSYCPKCNDIDLDESKESEESELITQYLNNGEFDKLEKIHNGTNVVWKLKEPVNETFDDDVDDLSYYYNEEDIIDALNDVWEEISSKQVADSDGFMTDYTMYRNINTGEYVFVFGDKDIYRPEDGYFDWECETKEEAEEWFNNYNGFDDLEDDEWEGFNFNLYEDVEESPIIHKKPDGSYLVAAENGDGYVAYNKSDVCMGNISGVSETEAKNKFNANKFDESLGEDTMDTKSYKVTFHLPYYDGGFEDKPTTVTTNIEATTDEEAQFLAKKHIQKMKRSKNGVAWKTAEIKEIVPVV